MFDTNSTTNIKNRNWNTSDRLKCFIWVHVRKRTHKTIKLSIYISTITLTVTVTDYTVLGCWKDEDGTDFGGYSFIARNMTLQYCADTCYRKVRLHYSILLSHSLLAMDHPTGFFPPAPLLNKQLLLRKHYIWTPKHLFSPTFGVGGIKTWLPYWGYGLYNLFMEHVKEFPALRNIY